MNAMPNEGWELEVGKANFESEVLHSKRPVLVVFWAPWSPACRAVEPVVTEVVNQAGGRVKLVKINADLNPELSLWYGIQSIPTFVYFVEGGVRARIVGAATKEALLAQLEPTARNTDPSMISQAAPEPGVPTQKKDNEA